MQIRVNSLATRTVEIIFLPGGRYRLRDKLISVTAERLRRALLPVAARNKTTVQEPEAGGHLRGFALNKNYHSH